MTPGRSWLLGCLRPTTLCAALLLGAVAPAHGQSQELRPLSDRSASFVWDSPEKRLLFVNVSFRDAIEADMREKLKRGLPTTIVMTATVRTPNRETPLATTAQSCTVTWHVWEEAYRLEITRPGEHRPVTWSPTVDGVLRRCAEATRLLAGTRGQVPSNAALYLEAIVQVNPVSSDVLARITRWVSRPSGTGTAAPGDALFSTFTGLFLQRIGQAERLFSFRTRPSVPSLP